MRELVAVALVDLGLVVGGVGALSLLRPLRFLGVTSRPVALFVLLGALALLAIGFLLPPATMRVPAPVSRLDVLAPEFQFAERHEVHVHAAPARVMEAVHAVTAGEIRLFRTLTWLRRFGRPGPENILNPPASRPILDVATSTGFALLAEEPGREVVVGTIVVAPDGYRAGLRARRRATPGAPILSAGDVAAATGPGFARALMNFRAEPDGDGTRLVTETRVAATDAASARLFARYWRVIYPGSAFIRRMWLGAIRARAEAP